MPALAAGLAFHPEDPSLLAGGAFNGDVLLWNLAASEDKLVGKSSLCNYTHHEPVQRVCWTRDTRPSPDCCWPLAPLMQSAYRSSQCFRRDHRLRGRC